MTEVRRATAADLELLAALEAASAAHPWSRDAIAGTLAQPAGRAWIATAGGEPVGHLLCSVAAGEAEILSIGVVPSHRRAGVGRALLEAGIAALAAEGVASTFLEVRADNAPARALYRGAGWEEIGRRRGYYADGTDAVLMGLAPGRSPA